MKNLSPCMGSAAIKAEFEVQRTLKRSELDSFPVPPQKSMWTHKGACRQGGTMDGLWRGEGKCILPKAGDADL